MAGGSMGRSWREQKRVRDMLLTMLFVLLVGGTVFVANFKRKASVVERAAEKLYFGAYYGDLAHRFDRPTCDARDDDLGAGECAVLDTLLLVLLFLLRGRVVWVGGMVAKTARSFLDLLDFVLVVASIICFLAIDSIVHIRLALRKLRNCI